MIFNDLVVTTKGLRELQRNTQIKNNIEQQNRINEKYRLLLFQINSIVDIVCFLNNVDFYSLNIEVKSLLDEILDDFESAIADDYIYEEKIESIENQFKNIQLLLKKEWPIQFSNMAESSINTLEALKEINVENVDKCLDKIRGAQTWDLDRNKYYAFSEGLKEAKKIIATLNLDDNIIRFLNKISNGKATLSDLDENVMDWIKKEKMENRIKISFRKTLLN